MNLNNAPLPDLRVDEVNAQPFRHGSLFSGIGGFDLAAEWMGWENVFHCEWNEFGKKVLNYYWPKAISYDDITKTDFTIHRGNIDILTGGFPCQPYSMAGKRLGKEDERHLFPEMLRAIREIAPRYIVGENVYGLVNWNGGMVFNEVQADLEAEGYEVAPVILPACAINAPHRRERIFFVAYANKRTTGSSRTGGEVESNRSNNNDEQKERGKQTEQHNRCGDVLRTITNAKYEPIEPKIERERPECECEGNEILQINTTDVQCRTFTDTGCSKRQNGLHGKEQGREATKFGDSYTKYGRFSKFPITEPTICGGNDGVSSQLDGITFPKWRNESIKAYGNAIVPQVVYQIFNAISGHEAEYGWR